MKISLIKNFKIIACFILLVVQGMSAVAQQKISLLRAVELAVERNLTIKQAQYNEALSEADLQQSKYNRLPNLTAGPQGSVNFGRNIDPSTNQFTTQRITALSGNISSQVVLFQGGQLRNQIEQNKILLEADRTNTAKVKNDLILNVVTTYLSVLNNQDLLTAAQQQNDIAKQTFDRSQISFNAGSQSLADLSQSKAQLSTADLNVTDAKNALDQSILTLKQYLEIPPEEVIEIEKPDISKLTVNTIFNAQEVYNTAVAVNPDVRLAELQHAAYEQAVKVAKGAYYPSLVMFGSAGSNYSDARKLFEDGMTKSYPLNQQLADNFNQSIGLSLQIPIFTRFNTRTQVRKANIIAQNAGVTAQLARNNLSKIIYQAVGDVKAAEQRYQSAIQTYNANKDAYNAINERFKVGLVNSLDLNTALTNLNKAEFDMIQARYQLVFRSKVIDYYLGNPITL